MNRCRLSFPTPKRAAITSGGRCSGLAIAPDSRLCLKTNEAALAHKRPRCKAERRSVSDGRYVEERERRRWAVSGPTRRDAGLWASCFVDPPPRLVRLESRRRLSSPEAQIPRVATSLVFRQSLATPPIS